MHRWKLLYSSPILATATLVSTGTYIFLRDDEDSSCKRATTPSQYNRRCINNRYAQSVLDFAELFQLHFWCSYRSEHYVSL
jgi:hypothetical protein